ncbi:MAG: response regulator transcription factor [Candidatus Delongbacteria bacterium]|nr:response regulator transcription factor [Candidatus Delongbacteria bacterium]
MQIDRNDIKKLHETYIKLLEKQKFDEKELDYSILDKQTPVLQKLAETSNSLITVFDLFKKKHVYQSSNFEAFLGYPKNDFEKGGEYFLDSKIHNEDYIALFQNGITLFKLLTSITSEQRLNCKLINEFRILNASNQFIRVIEQQQTLELDKKGNVWLALSILDISPNQNANENLKAQILNFKTGEFVPLLQSKLNKNMTLTKREIEILNHVKDGKLSKEISDKLFISVHTVNTHRQKILEKLNVNNSMEAIKIAANLGLV